MRHLSRCRPGLLPWEVCQLLVSRTPVREAAKTRSKADQHTHTRCSTRMPSVSWLDIVPDKARTFTAFSRLTSHTWTDQWSSVPRQKHGAKLTVCCTCSNRERKRAVVAHPETYTCPQPWHWCSTCLAIVSRQQGSRTSGTLGMTCAFATLLVWCSSGHHFFGRADDRNLRVSNVAFNGHGH